MIKRLELKNIQSHKHTIVEFSDGYNCIVGDTNTGKTALLRALYWVLYNRPTGTSVLNSKWNAREDGTPIEPFSVTLETDRGTLERVRSKTLNGYRLQMTDSPVVTYEAIKSDVPPEVQAFLNLSSLNVQRQMDAPFLLSSSAPEATRYLNEIVHLDSIDKLLGTSESARRGAASEEKSLLQVIDTLQNKLHDMDWLDKADDDMRCIDSYVTTADTYKQSYEMLEAALSTIREYKQTIQAADKITSCLPIVHELDTLDMTIVQKCQCLEDSIKNYRDSMNKVVDMTEPLSLLHDLQCTCDSYNSMSSEVDTLADALHSYKELSAQITASTAAYQSLVVQLPAVCPLCGSPVERGYYGL